MATVAIRSALVRLGFSAAAATAITDEQDLDSAGELMVLVDSEIESLCKVLRRPGGQVEVAGVAVSNPGTQVSLRAENNFKLAAYFLRHRARTSRAVAANDITLVNVRSVRDLRTSEDNHKNPTEKPTMHPTDWSKNLESLSEYLRSYLGETGIPLAYVVRTDQAPGADPVGGHSSALDEMISRAPHYNAGGEPLAAYLTDRLKVWELIANICRDLDCWSYVKPAQRTRNGRMAYENLYNHYLGPNNVDNMANTAESKLKTTTYLGEKKRWTFERYVRQQVDQHAILTGLVEHGYMGIDNRSKVRYLMDGIKTRELDTVKTQILANANLRNDFGACVTLFNDFLTQLRSTATAAELNIAAVITPEGKSIDKDPCELRYYDTKEYATLSSEQRDFLRTKRPPRDDEDSKRRNKRRKKQVSFSKGLNQLTRTVAKLATSFSDYKDQNDDEAPDSSEASEDEIVQGNKKHNRTNPALTRQKKRN